MDYPKPDEHGDLPIRARLIYCLGVIATTEAQLRSALLDCWQAAFDKSRDERNASRATSGRLARALSGALAQPEYEWISECRAALDRIAVTVEGRNDALHGEWMLRSDGFVSPAIVRANGSALELGQFESLCHELSVSADNAIGISTLIRFSKQRKQGRTIDPGIEQINRELVSRLP